MSADLSNAIIVFLGILGTLATTLTLYFKQKVANDKQKASVESIMSDREATKLQRDREAQDMRDALLKASWEIDNLKRESNHKGTLLDDLQKQVNLLNQNLAVNNKTMENLVDAIRELKEKR